MYTNIFCEGQERHSPVWHPYLHVYLVGSWSNTAVKRYTHARGLRKAREKQRQIVYKKVES